MRVAVLTQEQTPESNPEHFVSKSLAEKFLQHWHDGKRAAIRLNPTTIWIRVKLTFGKLKALLRPNGQRPIPEIKAPRGPEGLLLYYPHKSQETYA